MKPVEAPGADVAGVEVAGAELTDAPKEKVGALGSVAVWPKPVLGFGAGVDVVDDDPNVKPVFGGVISFGFASAAFSVEGVAPKLKDGAEVSFGLSVVVELFDPKENDGVDEVTPVLPLAGTWGGFDAAPKEKAGLATSGFGSAATEDGATRFLGRSDSFGLGCFDSGAAPKLKAGTLAFGASVVAVVVAPKLNDGVESFLVSSASEALRFPLLELSVVVLVAPNVNPPVVAVEAEAGAEVDGPELKEKDGAAAFSVTAGVFEASPVFLGGENPNEIGAVLTESSAVESDSAVTPKLKAGLSEAGAGVGAVKLNPPDVIPEASFSVSLLAAPAGTPKLNPLDEIDPAGFSVSFFESADGAPKLNPPAVIDPAAGLSSFLASAAGAPKLKPLDEIVPEGLGAAGAAALGADAPAGFAVSQHGHLALVASFRTLHPGHFHCPGFSCMNLARGFTAPLVEATGATSVVLGFSVSLRAAGFCVAIGFSGSFALGGFDTHSVVVVLGDEGMKSNGAAPLLFVAVF